MFLFYYCSLKEICILGFKGDVIQLFKEEMVKRFFSYMYGKSPKFSDAQNVWGSHSKIQTKRLYQKMQTVLQIL